MIFGFNHGLIRIKAGCGTIAQWSFHTLGGGAGGVLDLILIVDFNFNQMIATVVKSRNWKWSRKLFIAHV